MQRAAKGVVITQFDKDAVEHIGLVKIDLLGNRALATVDEAMRRGWFRPRQCGSGDRQSADRAIRNDSTIRPPWPCSSAATRWASTSWNRRPCGTC